MLQVRKLVLAVAAATAFSSSFTHALGLGDLAVKSSLNQPLEAEISLLEVRDLTAIEIKSQLASPEEFSKAGIDRQFFLTGLKFSPVIDANGKPFIRVTSSKPVKEPYLNFLVEVLWPNGRLLREYTLLLDPPLYRPQQVVYAPQPAVTAPPPRAVQSAPRQVRQPQPVARAAAPARVALQGTEYRVQKNDTLWEIAQRTGGNASVHQSMLAIQDLNPNAFIDGNINRMKSGQVLRLPTDQDIRSRSRADAIAQVSQQNTDWKAGRTAPARAERQLDATHRTEAGAAPAQIEKTDNLRLVADAPGQAGQAADQGSAAGLKNLQDQLALSKERLDSTILENEDLTSRVEDLNSQLDKLKRLIELKDNQLAQLQNSVDAPLESAVAAVVDDDSETIVAPAAADESAESLDQTEAPVEDTAGVIEALDAVQEPTGSEVDAQSEPEIEVTPEPEVVEQVAPEVEAVEPEVEAAATQPEADTAEQKSIVDTVMDDPMLLAATGGAAILALLLLLMAISRNKARKEAELYDEQLSETLTPDDTSLETTETDLLAASSLAAESDIFDESFAFEEPVADAQFKQEATDPIVEANSYISFGRFNQAADVLHAAIEQEPQRVDLRLKLLEVSASLEDHGGFSRQITEITEIGGAESELEQVKARYPHMLGAEQVANVADDLSDDSFADLSLDDLTLDSPEEFSAASTAQLDTELDDLSALLADTDSTDKPAETEFSLDLDLPESVTPAAETTFEFGDGFETASKDSLDLDIDSFDFDLDTVDEPQKASTDDEFSLDDLALELADTGVAEAPSFDLSEEFSLAEQDKPEATDFDLQIDEVSAELDSLSENLGADGLTEGALTDPRHSEFDLDDLDDFEPKPADEPKAAAPVSSNEADLQFADLETEDLGDAEDDFSFLSGTDETATKLDLARAYIDMGDAEGARDILDEVVVEGTAVQQDEARELINQLG